MKNSMAASRSSTTIPTLSIRVTVIMSLRKPGHINFKVSRPGIRTVCKMPPIVQSKESGAYSDHSARTDFCESRAHVVQLCSEARQPRVDYSQNDDTDIELRQVLLILEVLVRGEKNFEFGACSSQHFAMFQRRPSLFSNRSNAVFR